MSHQSSRVPNEDYVALEPFSGDEVAPKIVKGVLQNNAGSTLTQLKVVFESGKFFPGDTVHIRTILSKNSTFGREIFEVEGKKFILVPTKEVVLQTAYFNQYGDRE